MQPLSEPALIKDMVKNSGWLLLGDSSTEGHFFSLSCLLYPHARATPNHILRPDFDRDRPQKLFLKPDSPLVTELESPAGFSIESTPLVLFRRVGLLLNKDDIQAIYHKTYDGSTEPLWSQIEPTWTLSPSEYMPRFLDSFPEGNFSTMVVSTAGHWTATLTTSFRDEAAGEETGLGIERIFPLFKATMRIWAVQVQHAINQYRRYGGKESKRVVVRPCPPGHEDCHSQHAPWAEILPYNEPPQYNWPWIPDLNDMSKECATWKCSE